MERFSYNSSRVLEPGSTAVSLPFLVLFLLPTIPGGLLLAYSKCDLLVFHWKHFSRISFSDHHIDDSHRERAKTVVLILVFRLVLQHDFYIQSASRRPVLLR